MRTLILANILLFIYSCSEKKESQPLLDISIEKRLEFTKSVLKETDHTYNDIQKGGNPKFDTHRIMISEMLRKIETNLNRGDNQLKIDFSKEYDFFKYQDYYKVDYFKFKKLSPNEALFVIDQLMFSLRNSKLGNNYFKYSFPIFTFIQTHNGDSLDINYSPSQAYAKFSFIGPESYCDSADYLEKNVVNLWDKKLNISKYKIGDTVTGGILMMKMNFPIYVPFKFVKTK